MNTSFGKPRALHALALAMLVASPIATAQRAYPTPEAGADALVAALGNTKADEDKLADVLGAKWKDYVPERGAPKRSDVDAFLTKYRQKHAFTPAGADKTMLTVGDDGWVFPIPLLKKPDGWHFDLASGAAEIRDRAIGRNELDVMEALRAYRDAQFEYATEDRDGDRVLEYAQKLISTDGKHDGLYWAEDDSGEISPLGPLFGDDKPKGDFLGYHYRILTGQGASAPGGAYDYRLSENMTRGFGLVAWPAEYGKSGVMTFTISQDGVIFERDLGKGTDAAARAMKTFDPDSGWKEVGDGVATK